MFSNGPKANVTKHGQLISIQGSPLASLAAKASKVSAPPRLSASQARAAAIADVGGQAAPATVQLSTVQLTKWSNHEQAQLVWFDTASGLRLAWST